MESGTNVAQTADNLRSKDTIEAILGIGEGPMKGLVDGDKSFYIGLTPLQNANGDYNFKNFTLNYFKGTASAAAVVSKLGGSTSNHPVNTEMETGTPITRQTGLTNIDFIDFRFQIGRLMKQTATGTDLTSVEFSIEYKPSDELVWTKAFGANITLNGKTTSMYIKEYRVAVDRIDVPYDIRVTKISEPNNDGAFPQFYRDITWESYQETIAETRAYDNTAIAQLIGEASDQFASIPQFSGEYYGLEIQIPTNYNGMTREYTGTWDGEFKIEYTNNPAWVLYDLVMNDRYGMRKFYSEIVMDKYDVYEAAQWCDELVPDGQGGFQPRYTYNDYVTTPRNGIEFARYVAGVFNAAFFDDLEGLVTVRVDKDDPSPHHIFTTENIFGEFEYSYTDVTSRYNDITVSFVNPELNWVVDRRRVYNDEYIAVNDRIPLDFVAVGCTNVHEALRRAKYKMITANTETCMLTFRTNRLGSFVRPFDVILVCDPEMGYGISGRVKTLAEDRLSITLRDAVYTEAGVPYKIKFILKDGTPFETELVNTAKGYNYVLNFADAIPEDELADKAVFTLEYSELIGTPRPFRVVKVIEDDDNPDGYTIEAININRNKWADADNLTDTDQIEYSTLPSPFNPPGPETVGFTERYIKDLTQFQITVNPQFNRGAYKYYAADHSFQVWSRLKGTLDAFQRRDLLHGDTLVDHPAGLYEFKVLGVSSYGYVSDLATAPISEFTVTNPKEPPHNIDWIRINRAEVYWGYTNPPDDFAGFKLRYHNQVGRTTWEDGIRPHDGIITHTNYYTNMIPASARVIMVRAIDDFDTESESAIVFRDKGDIFADNLVDRFDYHIGSPIFNGTKVDCAVDDGKLKANSTGTTIYSNVPTAPMYDGGDFYEATYSEMYYYDTFTSTVDGDLIVEIDFEGNGYEIHVREVASPELPWEPVPERQLYPAGTYEFRLRLFGGPIRGIVNSLSMIIDAPDITEEIDDLVVSGTGLIRVPLEKTYSVIRRVSVILQGGGSPASTAVSYRVLDKDPVLGPEIETLDAAGSRTSALVDVTIKGY